MHFEGEFRVPGKAADVIRRFADVKRMARCMPGAQLEPQAEDGSWPGAMVVSFGPKKVKFKGRATCEFDYDALTGSVHGRGAADMRAARIGVKVSFALADDPVDVSREFPSEHGVSEGQPEHAAFLIAPAEHDEQQCQQRKHECSYIAALQRLSRKIHRALTIFA